MVEPVRIDLYGTEEGLLREAVKHSVNLDLDGYPRAPTEIPLDLTEYDHQGQRFALQINGGPPKSLNTYEHNGTPFQVSEKERSKGQLEKIKNLLRRNGAESTNYLAKDVSAAINEIEKGSLLFEVRGQNPEDGSKTKGEPVRTEIQNKEECLQRISYVEDLADDNEILDNDLLESNKSRYMGCSHFAETRAHTSPYKSWEDMSTTDIEVAAHIDVGLDYPVALGYLGERYTDEPVFGYRINGENGRISPSEFSKEEQTIARELEDVMNKIDRYLED